MTGIITVTENINNVTVAECNNNVMVSETVNKVVINPNVVVSGYVGVDKSFETVSKNLTAWDCSLNYVSGVLSDISYTDGSLNIVKTLNYTGDQLESITLTGDTPDGITLTKSFTYAGDDIAGITYS